MADKTKQRHVHYCPPEPWPKPNVLHTPAYRPGMTHDEAKAAWFAHVRRCAQLVPMPSTRR